MKAAGLPCTKTQYSLSSLFAKEHSYNWALIPEVFTTSMGDFCTSVRSLWDRVLNIQQSCTSLYKVSALSYSDRIRNKAPASYQTMWTAQLISVSIYKYHPLLKCLWIWAITLSIVTMSVNLLHLPACNIWCFLLISQTVLQIPSSCNSFAVSCKHASSLTRISLDSSVELSKQGW